MDTERVVAAPCGNGSGHGAFAVIECVEHAACAGSTRLGEGVGARS
jgi:hypothetical protein